jgi:hypothetical protein
LVVAVDAVYSMKTRNPTTAMCQPAIASFLLNVHPLIAFREIK